MVQTNLLTALVSKSKILYCIAGIQCNYFVITFHMKLTACILCMLTCYDVLTMECYQVIVHFLLPLTPFSGYIQYILLWSFAGKPYCISAEI